MLRRMTRKPLDLDQITASLSKVPGWEHNESSLCRSLQFADFVTAFGFMTSVALVAESMNHHPDWSNVYNRVAVKLSTHDAGGITELDFTLAERINAIAATHGVG